MSCLAPACARTDDTCPKALRARDWKRAVDRCPAPSPEAGLARAWLARADGDDERALAAADVLLDTKVELDAAYLAGELRARSNGDAAAAVWGRALLLRALAGFQAAGRHADASRAASVLSRSPRPEAPFEDALAHARVAVDEAALSRERRVWGRAETALAEVYDDIGREEDARDAFLRAEGLLADYPEDLAFTTMKHGMFLIDLEAEHEVRTGLAYLEEARARIRALGSSQQGAIDLAVGLNRASALAELGELEPADAEVGPLVADDPLAQRRIALVRGYVAARRGDLAIAEQRFAEAALAQDDLDYRWWAANELARASDRGGRKDDAERYFREAIAAVESLREKGDAELRPWLLAKRREPYLGLLALLAGQGRGLDALVQAESLHARTWLDVVLRGDDGTRSTEESLRRARVRQRPDAWPALDAEALVARLDGREAIVLITVAGASWRAHVENGLAAIRALTAADAAAIEAFAQAPDDLERAAAAGAVLLPPGAGERVGPLYVVASGTAATIPFAALVADGRRIVERRAIVRVPGLAALGCRTGTWTNERVFIGDAAGDLPQARAEVVRLAGAGALVGRAATRAAFVRGAGVDLLHVAVHGRVSAGEGLMALADGVVTASEILDRSIAPRVAVLTGCSTAASGDAESWGGFPSALLAAGSRHVVATLRDVPDGAAAEMVRAYYAQPEHLAPAERLAAAQRAVMPTLPAGVWGTFAAWGDAACDQ